MGVFLARRGIPAQARTAASPMTRFAYVRTRFGGKRRDFELPRDATAFGAWVAERRVSATSLAILDRHRDIVLAYLARMVAVNDQDLFQLITWSDSGAPVSVEHHPLHGVTRGGCRDGQGVCRDDHG
ncbi:hypothetical protein IU494_09250 [Nocardia terpenica]|uniref:hypothetical protein n=1 Tax=Nocardia terpenica TaxID=455432 RepID=UPI0018945CF6|nr:hypothetical protein [Nocardia terpenica]MBF6060966.1 hypothetical protein [Nocardia terpenica]MBF6111400.1 hypothetical protein [Nocardia terpenica]MBF6118447.1 hypothetical protein [Nocardia terpenica]MBF6155769.1 hypothetical protein [Nocardia terpenica]